METIPSAAEIEAKIQMALAEMGYLHVTLQPNIVKAAPREGWPTFVYFATTWEQPPPAVIWMSAAIAYGTDVMSCWSCWSKGEDPGLLCQAGDCQHPEGPARPPKELLIPRRDQ